MNGLPENFDGSSWIGRQLELICFAQYQVTFHFEARLMITVFQQFSFQRPGDLEMPEPVSTQIAESNLMELLGQTVTAAKCEGEGTLAISFSDGYVLRCYDPPIPYEAYHILDDGNLTVV
jgi:hypothetical protein